MACPSTRKTRWSPPVFASELLPGTSRGFGAAEFEEIGEMIADVLDGLAPAAEQGNGAVEATVKEAPSRSRALPDLI